MRNLSVFASVILMLLYLTGPAAAPCRADGEPARQDQSASETEKSKAGDEAEAKGVEMEGKVLHGGVRGTAVRLEEGLELISSSSKMVQNTALELAKECTRKEEAVMRGPNYIGNGIVIPALGGMGTGIVQAGELPARKDRVDAFISAAEQGIKALRTHVDGLIVPEGSSEEMINLWRGMQSSMQAAEGNINTMRELVAQAPIKRGEIKQKDAKPLGQAALKVYDSMTALTKMRNQLDLLVKPELKK
jgi:hypothetical protein